MLPVLKAIKQLFAAPACQNEAHSAYIALVSQSRSAHFYQLWEVPDTLDGRFDSIALHMALAVHALRKQGSPEALEFARVVSEIFFADMDRSLREMGSTDTGTGMRVKNMAQAFYGRLQAYSDAIEEGSLEAALARNLYRERPVADASIMAMASYARKNASPDIASLLSGKLDYTL